MRFSVIIPVYNVAPFLEACLNSVAAAARKVGCPKSGRHSVEIVCVDDGSTDGSAAMLDGYADACRTRNEAFALCVLHQRNAGVSAARNRALEFATGDWVVFVDADDMVRDCLFSDLERLSGGDPAQDLIGYGMQPIENEHGVPKWDDRMPVVQRVDVSGEIGDAFAGLSVCSIACRRGLLAGLRFPPLAVGEDQVFVFAALARARRCVLTSRALYGIRYRLNSVTRTEITLARLDDLLTAQTTMFRLLAESGKHLGWHFVQERAYSWLEALPVQLLARQREKGAPDLWERWLDSMRQVAATAAFDPWQRKWATRMAARRSTVTVRIFLFLSRTRRRAFWYAAFGWLWRI